MEDLAQTLKRCMNSKAEKKALLCEHNQTQQNASLAADRDRHLAESVNTVKRVTLAELEKLEKILSELTAMGVEVLANPEKAKVMNEKRTSSARPPTAYETVGFEIKGADKLSEGDQTQDG